MKTLKEWLYDESACFDAQQFIRLHGGLEKAWLECEEENWMQWLLDRLKMTPVCTCDMGSDGKFCPLRIFQGLTPDGLREAYPWPLIVAALQDREIEDLEYR